MNELKTIEEKKKVHVAKVVDLFAKIPEQFSLHFYDFSTIFKRIYKFAVFQNKRKRNCKLASRPLNFVSF